MGDEVITFEQAKEAAGKLDLDPVIFAKVFGDDGQEVHKTEVKKIADALGLMMAIREGMKNFSPEQSDAVKLVTDYLSREVLKKSPPGAPPL